MLHVLSTALSWHEWRGLKNCLPGRTYFETVVRHQCLVGIRHSSRPSTHRCFHPLWNLCWVLWSEHACCVWSCRGHWRCVLRSMRDKRHVLYHIFPDRKTELKNTIWDHVVTSLLWVKKLDTCQIVILLLGYFTKTVIDFTRLYNCVVASCVCQLV